MASTFPRPPTRSLHWNPHFNDEVLVTGDGGLRLYKTSSQNGNFNIDLKKDVTGQLDTLAINSDDTGISSTVVDWYPRKLEARLLAVGSTTTGKVTVMSMWPGASHVEKFVKRDFVPRASRACSQVAWSPNQPNLLAVGLDKANREPSLLIWDVETKQIVHGERRRLGTASEPYNSSSRMLGPTELAQHDLILSLAWIPDRPDTLLAGVGYKWLRVFDIRAGGAHTVSTARGAFELAVDPHSKNLFASFSRTDHAIKIWDLRHLGTEPVLSLNARNNISRISWCPTRPGLLGALYYERSAVTVYDLNLRLSEEIDQSSGELVTQRAVPASQRRKDTKLAYFSWHPECKNRLTAISTHGILQDFTIKEPSSLCWSVSGEISFSDSNEIHSFSADMKQDLSKTTEGLIKKRLKHGYGLNTQKNLEICADDEVLCALWAWLNLPSTLGSGNIMGIRAALNMDTATAKLVLDGFKKRAQGMGKQPIIATQDNQAQKKLAILLCGWSLMDDHESLSETLKKLEDKGEYERAAALAVFHQDIKRGIETLKSAAELERKRSSGKETAILALAMTLSGFSPAAHAMSHRRTLPGAPSSSDSLWRSTCSQIRNQLPSPLLRAAIGFLTNADDEYKEVLDEDIPMVDKLGFALRYLPTDALMTFLDKMSKKCAATGDILGILIEGLDAQGLSILAAYVDRTCDVQTPSILLSIALSTMAPSSTDFRRLRADKRFIEWLESYRELMDRWQLWLERAKFDIERQGVLKPTFVPPQVFVRCTYCGASVMPSKLIKGPNSTRYRGENVRRLSIMACPKCKKPLPRCAVCTLHLGTGVARQRSSSTEKSSINNFDRWFTWCQVCKHSGHANHLEAWFKDHEECPVSNCKCLCKSYDQFSSETFITNDFD
eukprot:m.134510 g.134510  ORF g.134510 m.134510 type:complete len:894 (+) comp14695_c0_seq4:96-2777(+)